MNRWISGLVLAGFVASGVMVGKLIPVEQRVKHVVVDELHPKLVNKEKIVIKDKPVPVYKAPDQWVAPVDNKAVCQGSKPVTVTQMHVQGGEKDDDGKVSPSSTWISVKPIGSNVTIICYSGGDWSDMIKEGQIISLNMDVAS